MHRRVAVCAFVLVLLLAVGGEAQMQPQNLRGGGSSGDASGRPADGPARGTIARFDKDSIVISAETAGEQTFAITARTRFVTERRIVRNEIAQGDYVLVLNDPLRGAPAMVKVLLQDAKRGREAPPFPMRGDAGQNGSRPVPQGGSGPGPGMQEGQARGPMRGVVTRTDPFTIEIAPDKTEVVALGEATMLLKELTADVSQIVAGARVSVIPQFQPGGGQREALKVILLACSREEVPFAQDPGLKAPSRPENALKYLDSPFGFLTAPPQPAYLFDLGVHWMVTGIKLASWEEIESRKGEFDFTQADKNIGYLTRNGVNTILELRANNPLYGTASGKREIRGEAFPEEHLAEWGRFVEKLVERYDGDGVDDAPGSPVVKNYQLIHELLIPGHVVKDFFRVHPEKYVKFFRVTYDAMKRSCSDCSLYFAGGFDEDFLFNGDKTQNNRIMQEDGFFVNVLRLFQKEGVRIQNIGFDYHFWSFWHVRPETGPDSYKGHVRMVDHIKRLYRNFGYKDDEVSIISKESGVNGYLDSEREQADYLVKIYASAIAAGQKHLFWTSIVEYSQEAELYLGMGLVHNPRHRGYSHKKLSYFTYQLMVDKLGGSDWKRVAAMPSGYDHVSVYRFPRKKDGRPVYVAWWDSFEEPGVQRRKTALQLNLQSPRATVTTAVPGAKNGSEIKDRATFPAENLPVRNGAISVILGTDPVFIEEGDVRPSSFVVERINPVIIDRLLNEGPR